MLAGAGAGLVSQLVKLIGLDIPEGKKTFLITLVYSIGEIFHNAQVIRAYEGKCVRTVPSIEEARAKGFDIIDATCPMCASFPTSSSKSWHWGLVFFFWGNPTTPEVIAATQDFSPHVTIVDHVSFDPDAFEWPKGNVVQIIKDRPPGKPEGLSLGGARVELATPSVSYWCSNQLS